MKAIRITCRTVLVSGRKAGSIVIPESLWPIMAATKQTVIPMVKISTITTMARAVAFLLFMHKRPISHITASVTSASPR